MNLVFKVNYDGHEIVVTAKRPLTTRLTLTINDKVVAESSRPVSTDLICGIKTWFGIKPVWEISGKLEINGKERCITARHCVTFFRQYVEIFIDGQMIGPEKNTTKE